MTRGRKPSPTSALKARGTYRADRHGARSDDVPTTRPTKPRDLPRDAGRLWDTLVPWLLKHGAVQTVDRSALEILCRFWALSRRALTEAEEDPTDKPKRIAAVSYASVFERMGAKFGMTPADRTRLSIQAEEKSNDKSRFFKVVS